ncbi:glutaredoxin family protein [Rhizobacter sp. J219]|jgi:glutaredoxin|uniref:glutaredoxin family protein n=1 Tax=Rhizobacter sp. J219 TaxID=2898430 RepID=UPI002150ACD8|nr:glutaredoxin family protein [Rhizobacter sp. J219]MCR5882741.1 glutaredoxin family protein [Rhizobacter sp. J219]
MSPRHRAIHTLAASVAAVSLLSAAPAFALYKVVGPDGKITYTDRPDVTSEKKVQPMSTRGGVANDVSVPFEVRQAALRYPVTLYVAPDCPPCDDGKQFLRQRGIPFSEKLVSTAEDGQALQRLTGSSTLPALTVGAQTLRGWQREDWASYLDAAGYPKESRLPANFPQGKAEPLTESRPAAAPAAQAPAPAPQRPPAPEPAPATPPSGIRF